MKTTFILILLSIFMFSNISANIDSEIEIGIVEKLDSTINTSLKFIDETGDTIVLGDYFDKPVILSLVFYKCPGICIALLSELSKLIGKLDMDITKDYTSVTISFDPNDTPEDSFNKKKNYTTKLNEAQQKKWKFLTGSQKNIDQITKAVGYKYKAVENGFNHPGVIIILSPNGKISRYLYGTNYLPFDVKMALIEAQEEKSRPTINKILNYCFAYDNIRQGYSMQITRVFGAITIFFALLLLLFIYYLKKSKKKMLND